MNKSPLAPVELEYAADLLDWSRNLETRKISFDHYLHLKQSIEDGLKYEEERDSREPAGRPLDAFPSSPVD